MSKIVFSIALLTLVSSIGFCQQLTGTIRDAIDGEPLVGANVVLDDSVSFTVTDPNGYYSFKGVDPGRHVITVSNVGYKNGKVFDVWVKNGKITTSDITLSRDFTGLQEVVITEPKGLSEIGRMTISEEQINRFAATYYDPARLVTISPDIAVSNDQNNRISVRGISPNYNVWRLEDVEIVNPNHLSNAGTFSDQPTSTGGGVNILSAQMLDNSSFLYSGFDATYANSIGGIFDMHLKTGNKEERQYTAQASLIGLDFSAEGPFSKNGDASYIVNYRYSFTGLLTSMGVDFGGESIGFQDLSFNVNKPLDDKGSISLFGVGGLNLNNFDAMPLDESEVQKDRSDIYYDGKMGALGMKVNYQLGNGTWMLSGAISTSDNGREQNFYDQNQSQEARNETSTDNQVYSFNSNYQFEIDKGQFTIGTLFSIYQYRYISENTGTYTGSSPFIISYVDASEDLGYSLFSPYFNFSYPILNFMQVDLGVNYNLSPDDYQIDPRATLRIFTSPRSELYFSAGIYSQLLNPTNYYFVSTQAGGDYYATLQSYDFIKSNRFILGYEINRGRWNYNTELFYYYFPFVNTDVPAPYSGTSDAQSYGLSLMGNRSFTSDWYMNFGLSIFESTWGREDLPNRYNLKQNLNASIGKEWFFEGKPMKRSLGANAKVIYQGGLVDPINETALMGPPSTNNADYYRIDIRIQWTRYLEKRTTSISLDLQNVSNNENDAYTYYDAFTGQREQQTQLGLIPILTYRMEF